jgi:hypothetical protein
MEKRIAITLAAREQRLSMLQDLARPTREIGVLACFIAEMRSLVDLTTPTIDMAFDRALAASETSDLNANPANADRSTLRQSRPSGLRFNSRRGCPNVEATATAKTCSRTQED